MEVIFYKKWKEDPGVLIKEGLPSDWFEISEEEVKKCLSGFWDVDETVKNMKRYVIEDGLEPELLTPGALYTVKER